jgi:hypothetical protein
MKCLNCDVSIFHYEEYVKCVNCLSPYCLNCEQFFIDNLYYLDEEIILYKKKCYNCSPISQSVTLLKPS